MDFVPFTLFFMVCLLTFQGNVMGKPATNNDLKAPWTEDCEEELTYKNYCIQKPKHGYPSDDYLKKLYFANKEKFEFQPQMNETRHRYGENICRDFDYFVQNIYMIRDEHKNIRYALNIPEVYQVTIPVNECKHKANRMLDDQYKENNIRCEQKTFQYPFIVLSDDMKRLESTKILAMNSYCDPVQY